ncbi:MAG TPA: hypothetical protein PKX06_08875 [Phenylobacterium sp.]|nr:hypothetical protein [Phenylobacterium sp.]
MSNPLILRPCRFCGEHEHLSSGHSIPRPVIENGDTKKGADGSEIIEEVDGVHCQVCEAMAPLDVWNGERPQSVFAILRDFDPEPQQVAA